MPNRPPLWLLAAALFTIAPPPFAGADETASFALFERSVAPSYVWGQNGLMLTPIADTLGKWNFGVSTAHMNAGRIQDNRVLDSKGTLTVDTNGFFEFGYTRKVLLFPGTMERTPFTGNVYHLKSKLLDFESPYIPKFAMGAFAFNIRGTRKIEQDEMFADIFGVLQEDIPLTEGHLLRFHAGLENGVLGSTRSNVFLFGGVDYQAFDKLIDVMAELQGASRSGQSGIINLGVAVNVFHFAQAGVGLFNAFNFGTDRFRREFMFQVSFVAPMDRIYEYAAGQEGPAKKPETETPPTPAPTIKPPVTPEPAAQPVPATPKPAAEPEPATPKAEQPPASEQGWSQPKWMDTNESMDKKRP